MRQRGSILLYAILALAILAALSGIAYKIRESGKDAIRVEWAEANRLQREAEAKQAATASTKLETGNAKAQVVYRTITKEVDKIVTRDVYRNVCLDDDGLRVVRDAIRGEIAPPAKPDKPVPKPAGTDGRDGGIGLALDRSDIGAVLGVRPEASGTH